MMLDLLSRSIVTVKLGNKRNGEGAHCDFDDWYPPRWIRITIDANNNENVKFVMHELIHVMISELILGCFDETLKEAFLLGLENWMWDFISKSPQRLAKWEKALAVKIAESEALKPEATLADMVIRPPAQQ